MLGRTHATSGAAAWLVGMGVLHWAHHPHPASTVVVGTVLAAGGALLPDLDMSGRVLSCQGGATVAHTFGPVSLFAAELVEKASLGVYDVTRTRRDPHLTNGHRTATHTLLAVLLLGVGVFELCRHGGRWAIAGCLFVTFAAAVRGLFAGWAARAGWAATTLTSAGAAGLAWWWLPAASSPLLAIAVGFGALIHLAGDCCTEAGCPPLAPVVPVRGRRWYRVGLPVMLRMRTGGRVEAAWGWLFTAAAFAGVGWLVFAA